MNVIFVSTFLVLKPLMTQLQVFTTVNQSTNFVAINLLVVMTVTVGTGIVIVEDAMGVTVIVLVVILIVITCRDADPCREKEAVDTVLNVLTVLIVMSVTQETREIIVIQEIQEIIVTAVRPAIQEITVVDLLPLAIN